MKKRIAVFAVAFSMLSLLPMFTFAEYEAAITSVKIGVAEYSPEDMFLSAHDIVVGETLNLSAEIEPQDVAGSANTTWTSSDPDVLSVDSKGAVTPVKAGEATVTLRAGSMSDSISFNVKSKPMTTLTTYLLIGFGIIVLLIIIYVTVLVRRITRRRRITNEVGETRSIAADNLKRKINRQKAQNARRESDSYLSDTGVDRRTRIFTPIADDNEEWREPPKVNDYKAFKERKNREPDKPFSLDDID